MKRLLFLLAVAALALPAAASAKGPSEATITGPGLAKAITITGTRDRGLAVDVPRRGSRLLPGRLRPGRRDPMRLGRPKGDLGPRYSIDYNVPGRDGGSFTIRQDLYPYAKPYAVTYMKPQASRSST